MMDEHTLPSDIVCADVVFLVNSISELCHRGYYGVYIMQPSNIACVPELFVITQEIGFLVAVNDK